MAPSETLRVVSCSGTRKSPLHQGGDRNRLCVVECGGLAGVAGSSGPSRHAALRRASSSWHSRNALARPVAGYIAVGAFVYVPLSENAVEDNSVQTNVDVPEDPAPNNYPDAEKCAIATIIVFGRARREPAHNGGGGDIMSKPNLRHRPPAGCQVSAASEDRWTVDKNVPREVREVSGHLFPLPFAHNPDLIYVKEQFSILPFT